MLLLLVDESLYNLNASRRNNFFFFRKSGKSNNDRKTNIKKLRTVTLRYVYYLHKKKVS